MDDLAKPLARPACAVRNFILAILLGLPVLPVQAGQVSSQFNVTATLISANSPALPKTVFCRSSPALAFGAIVTVVCATGAVVDITAPARGIPWAPVHGGAYRYIMQGSYAGDGSLPDAFDGYVSPGTAATWRLIQVADRDYLELLVGW